ncbi:MAG: hypothetical protein R2699_08970 [Acidimicrobiales bacterium]
MGLRRVDVARLAFEATELDADPRHLVLVPVLHRLLERALQGDARRRHVAAASVDVGQQHQQLGQRAAGVDRLAQQHGRRQLRPVGVVVPHGARCSRPHDPGQVQRARVARLVGDHDRLVEHRRRFLQTIVAGVEQELGELHHGAGPLRGRRRAVDPVAQRGLPTRPLVLRRRVAGVTERVVRRSVHRPQGTPVGTTSRRRVGAVLPGDRAAGAVESRSPNPPP